ncbi:anti-sigma factor family protein [Paractinoplanes globisporus]|uniref:Anti-sigma factor family protein n=1 Tax=Paractinoplanes globisporus TaxID=113565 RepID=A0ABW6W5Q9_9ACTN|nr:zf-HC2 domain-containing protein [Actinoplanes globisporus]
MSTPESTNPTNDHVDLAGYLMEMLTPDEKQRADSHLAGCAACREEIESLQEWSSALRDIPEEMLLDGPPEDADLVLQRTLRQVRQESSGGRLRRLTVLTTAAAAIIAVAVGGGVILGRGTAPETPPQAQGSPSASVPAGTQFVAAADPATGARINATITPAMGWVRLSATVGGIPAGEKCRLEVVGKDGSAVLAGSWLVSPAGEANGTTLNGSALIEPSQVAAVRVVNTDGKQFVSVNV